MSAQLLSWELPLLRGKPTQGDVLATYESPVLISNTAWQRQLTHQLIYPVLLLALSPSPTHTMPQAAALVPSLTMLILLQQIHTRAV
jgi:hypothetical protein